MYLPDIPETKLDFTLLPVWFIALTCIGIGAFLAGKERTGLKQTDRYERRTSQESEQSCVVIEDDEDDDIEKITNKQVLGKYKNIAKCLVKPAVFFVKILISVRQF